MQQIIAKILLGKKAVKIDPKNPFTWTSGIISPIYCDNRLLISYPDAVKTITQAFKKVLEKKKFDVIAGTATAGIPWAAFLALTLKKPMIYIRSKPKEHGTKSQIEGKMEKGKKIIIIEDLVSTGKSSLEAVEAVRCEGGKVSDVVSIFQYGFPQALEKFKEGKCNLTSLTNFKALLNELSLTLAEKKEILEFSKNPAQWRK